MNDCETGLDGLEIIGCILKSAGIDPAMTTTPGRRKNTSEKEKVGREWGENTRKRKRGYRLSSVTP
jgi:hypothetical protein